MSDDEVWMDDWEMPPTPPRTAAEINRLRFTSCVLLVAAFLLCLAYKHSNAIKDLTYTETEVRGLVAIILVFAVCFVLVILIVIFEPYNPGRVQLREPTSTSHKKKAL